jgi:hypothetical protein
MLIPDIFDKYPSYKPVKGVIHIGAHKCEEKDIYNSMGVSDDSILWIEANPYLVVPPIVHGVMSDVDGEVVNFHVASNGQSSSILAFKEHLVEHPWVFELGIIPLQTTTLNTLFSTKSIPFDTYDVMNLDIQGAELKALKGSTLILPHIKSIYTEVNTKELYENCAMLHELDSYLESFGFTRVETSMTEHGWGDAFYIKKD